MNCNLHEITYLTLHPLLRVKLCEVIYLLIDAVVEEVSTNTTHDDFDLTQIELLLESLSLKQTVSRTFGVVYPCSIAFKLSSVLRRSALEVAYQIIDRFNQKDINFCQEDMTISERILSDFTGKVFSNGLLQFELSDHGLATWLQSLINPSGRLLIDKPDLCSVSTLKDKRKLFLCQHSHARCCSLLRHAHGSMITLTRLDDSLEEPWGMTAPDSVPWLTAQGDLLLTHPAEQRLIAQTVTIVDDFPDVIVNSQSCLKFAIRLSQAFQDFHQACRIFEADSETSWHLSQGRLGLVMITQRLLRQLIEVGLNEQAPSEL